MTERPDDRLHPATAGFQLGAAAYEAARPSYPAAVVDLIRAEGPLGPGRRVVDVAAGTGKLTRLLVPTGAEVVAVEPVAGMREQLELAVPGVEVRDGTAEELPLGDGEADVATVAQAFHWFDPDPAVAELHRVLRPGGALFLIWNVRDEREDWVSAFTEIIVDRTGGRPYTPYAARRGRGDELVLDDSRIDRLPAGGFEPLRRATFANPVETDVDGVVARAASTSFVAALPEDRRAVVLDEIRDLVTTHPATAGRDRFPFPHETAVVWTRRDGG